MAKKASSPTTTLEVQPIESAAQATGKYTVVARRYRPKTFAELVGQSTVAQALVTAIQTNRVGHAYLFTGARGVGKTSTARIFAKALNASVELDGNFDPTSDIALAIDSGEDMDVIEIDGASNRGIDEIRQLRANASIRPSRARYKIYIIDEVHMLTPAAFNALLKTLEEPPGHVKFIFCTTDPEKMPITVLSRCQRFDFPPVHSEEIYQRLKFICDQEGAEADEAALRLISRRAAGSLRDSQSLLEQLLSFGGNKISSDTVHSMLGTADETRLGAFAEKLILRDAAAALTELDKASHEGVDVGQLAEQLLGYLRDMMAISVGGSADLVRTANPNSVEQLKQMGQSWGTMTLLSALQLLDETIVKMRHSVQSRVLLEIALVQICNLQDLQSLSELVKAFAACQAPAVAARPALPKPSAVPISARPVSVPAAPIATAIPVLPGPQTVQEEPKKKDDLGSAESTPNEAHTITGLTEPTNQFDGIEDELPSDSLEKTGSLEPINVTTESFIQIAKQVGGFAQQCAEMTLRVERMGGRKWKVYLSKDGTVVRDYFETGDNARRLVQAMKKQTGQEFQLTFEITQEENPLIETKSEGALEQTDAPEHEPVLARQASQSQLIRSAMGNELVKQFMDMFEGQIIRVDQVQQIIRTPNFQKNRAIEPETEAAEA